MPDLLNIGSKLERLNKLSTKSWIVKEVAWGECCQGIISTVADNNRSTIDITTDLICSSSDKFGDIAEACCSICKLLGTQICAATNFLDS